MSDCKYCPDPLFLPPGDAKLYVDARRDHAHLVVNGQDISGAIEPGLIIQIARDNEFNRVTVTYSVAELEIAGSGIDFEPTAKTAEALKALGYVRA